MKSLLLFRENVEKRLFCSSLELKPYDWIFKFISTKPYFYVSIKRDLFRGSGAALVLVLLEPSHRQSSDSELEKREESFGCERLTHREVAVKRIESLAL